MYEENKLLFTDVAHARSKLRYIEGKSGTQNRKNVKSTHHLKKEDRPKNPYNLPESDEVEWTPYKLRSKRTLVLSDIHLPYHSLPALNAAIRWGKDRNPDTILLNGDTIDAHLLSRFVKDPKKRDFAGELKIFREFFEVLQKQFPKAQIVFKIGNHEERYDHFLMQKAHELIGVEEFSLENIIKARANGIEVIGEKRIIKAGGLNVLHGHEFAYGFFNPVNVARGLFLRAKASALQGHNHQTSEHTEMDINEDITTTFSVGCLCELHPLYMPINKWNHGVCDIEIDGKNFDVTNKRIYKGEVL